MKKELREKVLEARNNISNKEFLDFEIVKNLKRLIGYNKNILIYYPIKNEANILGIIDSHNVFFFPYCKKEDIECRMIDGLENLILDEKGIPSSNIKSNAKIDIVISPAIAMNVRGYRLGYGKGYYDRYLQDKDCLKIAVVYDQFVFDEEYQDQWDVCFDYIVTDKRIIEVK